MATRKAKTRASVTGPDGETVQREYMPCGVRRCNRCFEGEMPKGASLEELKQTRRRRQNPEGHGPYFRVYSRSGGRFTGRIVRRDEEAALEAEMGKEIWKIQPKRWGTWREQPSVDEQTNRSGTRRGPTKGTPRNTRKRSEETRPDPEDHEETENTAEPVA